MQSNEINEKDKKVKRKKYSDEVSEEENSFALLEEKPQVSTYRLVTIKRLGLLCQQLTNFGRIFLQTSY